MNEPATLLLVSTAVPDARAVAAVVQGARDDGLAVHAVSELLEELPKDLSMGGRSRLDDHRRPDMTIRNAAERADRLLRELRPLLKGRFEQRGRSLWLAQESYLLHFHLLRVLDLLDQVGQILDDVRPVRIVCAGPITNLTKVFTLVAESRGIPLEIRSPDRHQRIAARLWRLQRTLLACPSLYLASAFLFQAARTAISARRKSPGANPSPDAHAGGRKTRVTFLGSNRKQSDITVQLADFLEETGDFECRFLNMFDEDLARHLESQGLQVSRLGDEGYDQAERVRGASQRRFLRDAIAVFGSRSFRERFVVGGVDFWPLTGYQLARFALATAPDLATTVERAVLHLAATPADIVITPAEWDPKSRACVIAAGVAGAASLSLQRGDITGFPGWSDPIFSDSMAVNGPAIKEALVSNGVPEAQLVVTGDSRLDLWVGDAAFFHPGETREKLGIPGDRKLVAVMTNPVALNEKASHAEDYVSGLLELEREDRSLHFVIKLHPNETDFSFYERIRDRVGAVNVTVIRELNTPQLLFDADAVVTTISTTGEEAIFLGKPLVVVNLTNEPDFMPYVGSSAAITVRDRADLAGGLRRALDDEATRTQLAEGRRDYVAKHFLSDDGRSSQRCVELIRKLLEARPGTPRGSSTAFRRRIPS